MKSYKAKQMMSVMLLLGAFMAPMLAHADPEEVAAIKTLDSNNQNSSNSILQFMNQHMKNDKWAQALINYEAAARVNEYQYNQQLLLMAAPGSIWAVNAGGLVGKTKVGEAALQLTNSSLLAGVQNLSTSNSFSGPLVGGQISSSMQGVPAGTVLTKDNVYTGYFQPFIQNGDTSGLTVINLGQFLQTPNLTKGGIPAAMSQQMISLSVNPFPSLDPKLTNAIAASKTGIGSSSLSGADQEAIVDAIVANAARSASESALSDIVARRTPGTDGSGPLTQSVMESMDNYSSQRFTNPAWYTQLSTASDTALLREIAHMDAFSIYMQFQQFRVLEQQMAIMATMNSVMANINVAINNLNVQLQQAAAKAQQASDDMKAAQSKCGSNQYADMNGNCVDIPSSSSQ